MQLLPQSGCLRTGSAHLDDGTVVDPVHFSTYHDATQVGFVFTKDMERVDPAAVVDVGRSAGATPEWLREAIYRHAAVAADAYWFAVHLESDDWIPAVVTSGREGALRLPHNLSYDDVVGVARIEPHDRSAAPLDGTEYICVFEPRGRATDLTGDDGLNKSDELR